MNISRIVNDNYLLVLPIFIIMRSILKEVQINIKDSEEAIKNLMKPYNIKTY